MVTAANINGFARAITRRFRESAKGLDAEADRFVKARPSERILAGFLTPVDPQAGLSISSTPAGGAPDVPSDDDYEQTHIGFEWALPTAVIGSGLKIHLAFTTHVYARVLPTYQEAIDNARMRNGTASLVEIWQRFPLRPPIAAAMAAPVDLDALVADGARVISLEREIAQRWQTTAPADLYPWRTEQIVREADLRDSTAYAAYIAGLQRPRVPEPLTWKPTLDIRAYTSPADADALRVLVRIVNRSDATDARSEAFVDHRLYAVSLTATIPAQAHSPTEFRSLPNSYRYDRRVPAIGINCEPEASLSAGVLEINAETVPVTEAPRLMPREIEGGSPEFERLADERTSQRVLSTILDAMRDYDRVDWKAKIDRLVDQTERREAEESREMFRKEIAAFARGIEVLSNAPDGPAARAFRLMNAAMMKSGRRPKRPITKWHLFQIVFIVSRLPDLIEAAEAGTSAGPLQILWFPAGGGKTEAFLGLLVWHALRDRIRGKSLGVTAFLRYPLRLLTYQQLQRVTWVLGKAEEVRLENGISGEPFSLGYYVGQSTTPNSIDDVLHRQLTGGGVPANWQRVFRCPSCGAREVRLRYDSSLRLIEHYCANKQCRTQGSRLPVYIVDDDLYRYLPTVIVSTVDKLAQLGQNRRFSQLLGRIQFYCPIHGAAYFGSNERMCAASADAKAGRLTGTCNSVPVVTGPFTSLGPSLHVQDEMHLLREALATFDSHYETGALALQRQLASGGGWALIGSTATIEGYREQAAHLYLREANRFPAPGPEAYESFYYTTDPQLLGRLFIGVLGVGRTHTPSVARTISLLYGIVERARALGQRDLQAARTFLGLANVSSADIAELSFLYEVILSYVLTRKGGDQVAEAIDVRVRREVEELTDAPLRVETFNGNVEMPQMIGVMEEIEAASPDQPLGERVRGVVATNVISHGVDIDRFNVMVFAGLPRQFAEYIQASARVGRQLPGISVLVVTPQSERDRSVFDRFRKCHEYVDRLVEPVPVNRWSEPALELTLPGLIAAYLMGVAPTALGRELYMVGHVQGRFGTRGAEALDQDQVMAWVRSALGADTPLAPPEYARVVENLAGRLYGKVTGAAPENRNETLSKHLGAMRSLRDIDDPAWVAVYRDADKELIRTLGT